LLALRRTSPALAGFTLIELLAVLAIASLLLGYGAPGLQTQLEGYRLRSAAADLLGAVHLARSEAIARGAIVLLTPADPAGVDWRQGWQVFVDRDGDRRPGPGDSLLMRHAPVDGKLRIWSRFSANTPPLYIAYNSAGRSCKANTGLGAHFGTLSLEAGKQQRNIKINMLGRARLCDPAREPSGCTAASG
jgi:type IV fimbrial biogenesis protein FimT